MISKIGFIEEASAFWHPSGIGLHATLCADYSMEFIVLMMDLDAKIMILHNWELEPGNDIIFLSSPELLANQEYHV